MKMKETSKKYFVFALLFLGAGLTQFFQNCAPLDSLQGFSTMSSLTADAGAGSHPSLGNQKSQPSQRNLLVPRTYVAQIFREVFTSTRYVVPNLESNINKWVMYKGAQYGGNCNIYSDYSTRDCGGSLSNTNIDVLADGSTVRESFRIQMCDYALGTDIGVNAALEKASLTNTSGINAQNIAAVHGLFYRSDPPSLEVISTLLDLNQALVNANESPMVRWRAILSQICESPGWEVL